MPSPSLRASPAWAETIEIDLGAVVLIVSDSPTAQVFHIVDQLSEWDAFAHRQYGRWARVALTPTRTSDRSGLEGEGMLRLLICLLLTPAAALAQGATATQKPAQKPSAPAPGAPKPAAPAAAAPKPLPAGRAPARTAAPLTDDQKPIYALGLLMQRSLDQFDLSAAELDIVKRALTDAAARKPAIEIDEWGPKIEGFASARTARVAAREKAASVAYLAKAAAEPGVVRTDSGLIYRDLSPGTGPSPTASDTVKVHYRGTLINGTEFDSSYRRNQPAQFPLGGVIPCWTEGVQKMKVGGKARLVCPSGLAYGDAGRPSIPGGATLLFEVELLEIVAAAPQ